MSATISLDFGDVVRSALNNKQALRGEQAPALRMALLYGEQLHLPSSSEELRVLSGTAWLSADGKDFIVDRGDALRVPRSKYDAIVSPVGDDPLFFEVA